MQKKYGIPVIRIHDLIEEAKVMANPLGDKVREELEETKRKKIEELEAQAKKKKGMEVNPDLVIPRLSVETLWEVYRYKLSQRIYQTKGYILDGYPKTYADACQIFLGK